MLFMLKKVKTEFCVKYLPFIKNGHNKHTTDMVANMLC